MSETLLRQLRSLLAEAEDPDDLRAYYDSMTNEELLAELDVAALCLKEGRPYRPRDPQGRAGRGKGRGMFDNMSNEELLAELKGAEARVAQEEPEHPLVRGPGVRFSDT